MTIMDTLEQELSALESLLDEDSTPIEENPVEVPATKKIDDIEIVEAKPIDTPADGSDDVTALVVKARDRMEAKFHTAEDAEAALNAVIGQVAKINDALMAMAKCSKQFANGDIDDKMRCQQIRDIMEDIRILVKELQLQMGRNVDKDSVVTEAELRDFRDYLEGFIKALRDRISCLRNGKPVDTGVVESKVSSDDNEEDYEIDEEDDDKKEAMEFASICESLMVNVDDSSDDNLESSLESILNDLTDFL